MWQSVLGNSHGPVRVLVVLSLAMQRRAEHTHFTTLVLVL